MQKKKESRAFKERAVIQKDHPKLRSKGRFTSGYNQLPKVRESKFKSLEEKIGDKRFASMSLFSLSRESIMRYTRALFFAASGYGERKVLITLRHHIKYKVLHYLIN